MKVGSRAEAILGSKIADTCLATMAACLIFSATAVCILITDRDNVTDRVAHFENTASAAQNKAGTPTYRATLNGTTMTDAAGTDREDVYSLMNGGNEQLVCLLIRNVTFTTWGGLQLLGQSTAPVEGWVHEFIAWDVNDITTANLDAYALAAWNFFNTSSV